MWRGITTLLNILILLMCMSDCIGAYCDNCSDWCLGFYGPTILSGEVSYKHHSEQNIYDRRPGIDQAQMLVKSKSNNIMSIMVRSSECYNCTFQKLLTLEPNSHATVLIDTKHTMELQVMVQTIPQPNMVCMDRNHFSQHGKYIYYISPNNTNLSDVIGYICVLSAGDPPLDANVPVWVLIAVIVVLFSVWNILIFLDNRYALYARVSLRTPRVVHSDLGIPQSPTSSIDTVMTNTTADVQAPVLRTRLHSLDTFRGISIILMIFVNYGGGEYWYFQHAAWNGLTVADLVFPWFVFIMGTSMFFSFDSQIRRSVPWYKILGKVCKRSLILILLGLVLNSKPKCPHRSTFMENLRLPGVLQRFGVTYFFTAVVHLAFVYKQESWRLFHALEWFVHLLGMLLYLTLTFLSPVPGCPTGYLGPGGRADQGRYEKCTGGAAGYIDRRVFGDSHIYQNPTSQRIYGGTVPYDPEGLLGCLTSIFLCFLGLQAGKLFQKFGSKAVTGLFLVFSIVCACLGLLLCTAGKEGGWIPINKNLWSPSYILCMAGTSYFLLAICHILIDRFGIWTGAPFVYAGMNPILLYVGHEILQSYLPVSFHVSMDHWSQLAMDVWGAVFWIIVAYVLHRKKFYVSI